MLRKNSIHCVIALIGLMGCSSDPSDEYLLEDIVPDTQDTSSSSDYDPGSTDPRSADTGSDTGANPEFTCNPLPLSCRTSMMCNLIPTFGPVTGKTCPQGQICCGPQESSTSDTGAPADTTKPKPLCTTAGEGHDCVNERRCRAAGGKADDDYRCSNTDLICCSTVDEPDTTDAGTETDKPLCDKAGDDYECLSRIRCQLSGGTVDDDYQCNDNEICCNTGDEPDTTDTGTEADKPLCNTAGDGYECISTGRCRLSRGTVDDDYRCENNNQICCKSADEPDTSTETETSKPLCDTAGEGYECLSTWRCQWNGGTADDDYQCENNNQICCKPADEPDTSTETETDTGSRTECPDEYECVGTRQCTEPDIVHDEFICGLGFLRVCCETVDVDAGTLDSGL